MGEKNPLQVSLPRSAITAKTSNRSGRPTMENIVKYSPQPKSIVAQMLSKMSKNNGVYRNESFGNKTKDSPDVMNNKSSYNDEENKIPIYLPMQSTNRNITNKSNSTTLSMSEFSTQPKYLVDDILEEMKRTDCDDDGILVEQERSLEIDKHSSIEETKEVPKYKQFMCDFPNCKYSCKLSSNLIKHKRVHTNEKPYLCEKCSFRSNFVNSLKAHKRTHTAERPYQCKHCDYKCNSSSNLKKHCLHRHPISIDCPCVT